MMVVVPTFTHSCYRNRQILYRFDFPRNWKLSVIFSVYANIWEINAYYSGFFVLICVFRRTMKEVQGCGVAIFITCRRVYFPTYGQRYSLTMYNLSWCNSVQHTGQLKNTTFHPNSNEGLKLVLQNTVASS